MSSSTANKPLVLQGFKCGLPEPQQRIIDREFEIIFWDSPLLESKKKDVVGLVYIGYPTRVDADFLDQYPSLRVVSNHGVGVDRIDVAACVSRGIKVGNTPDVLSGVTADMAFSLLLASARRVCEGDGIARSPSTRAFELNWLGTEVTGATIGIVGLGRIGKKIALRALGFKMRILYYKRNRLDENTEKELSSQYYNNLLDMLPECDFVVLVLPGNEETYKMFSVAEFGAMKKTAIFVNVGRGSAVDQEALTSALTEGRIAGAGVDVTDPEPLPRDHPLLQAPNLTISPHCGSATMKSRLKLVQRLVDNILCALRGETLISEVFKN